MTIPTVKHDTPKAEGQSFINVYEAQIIDESLIPDCHKIVNMKSINAVVKALKDNANIPGVKVIVKKQLRQRT